MLEYGFQAIISTKIADIFAANALKNGLLAVTVSAETQQWLMSRPGEELEIDLLSCELRMADAPPARFSVEPFARYCLLNGIDQLSYLLQRDEMITVFEKRRSNANSSNRIIRFDGSDQPEPGPHRS